MKFSIISGAILVLPILITRFLVLALLNKEAVRRAAFLPPTLGFERIAYQVNVLTTLLLMIVPFFLQIKLKGVLGISGLFFFIVALALYAIAIVQFAKPDNYGLNISGLYTISRNPMYVSFFLYFLGCCMLTSSRILLLVIIVFQISVHFLIISEERWCIEEFGDSYRDYIKKVRRYL
jgi:protein-S-isoprenylcysteine O-methyltransferase Ste14